MQRFRVSMIRNSPWLSHSLARAFGERVAQFFTGLFGLAFEELPELPGARADSGTAPE